MELQGDSAVVIKGTCQTMCPASELRLREKERLLHPLEICEDRAGSSVRPKADPDRTVKEYSRPAAGRVHPSPAEIRPGPVLLRTVIYLFERVVPCSEMEWVQVYDFVFDRLRAVRQDAVLQALGGSELITLLEHIVRFYVYAGYRLCEAPAEMFDAVINSQHLLECLKQLLRLYVCTPGPHENQDVFEAVYLLHNLGSSESAEHGVALPLSLRHTTLVQDAIALNLAFLQGNFVRFFRHSLQLSSALCLCAVHRHFYHMRMHALRVMSVAYSSKTCHYPLSKLQKLLCTDRGQLVELLHACGLLQEEDKITAQHINFLKSKFSMPTKVYMCKQSELDTRLLELDSAALLLGKLQDDS